MSRLLFLSIVLVACASMSLAQSTTDYHKVEVFGGFSHSRVDESIDDSAIVPFDYDGFNGFNASITGNVTRYFGLKFDLSGHFRKKDFLRIANTRVGLDSSVFNFLGGVQLKDNAKEAWEIAYGPHLEFPGE